MQVAQHKSAFLLILLAWAVSTLIFVSMYKEQLTLFCAGIAQPRCVSLALLFKPKLNKRLSDYSGVTPLVYLLDRAQYYSEEQVIQTAQSLLAAGADPNVADDEGWSPLMIASSSGNLAAVKLLVERGANVNRRAKARSNLDGMTALMTAAHHGHSKVIEYLLQKGAKPELRSSKGLNAVTIAAMEGHQNAVQLLRQSGSQVDKDILASLEMADQLDEAADADRSPASLRRPLRKRRPEE